MYETDFTGPYTVIIGLPVSTLEDIPEGYVGISIKKAMFQKLISKGKIPKAVVKTRMKIWQNKTLNRAYKADFTVLGEKYFNGDQAEVETYISVKECRLVNIQAYTLNTTLFLGMMITNRKGANSAKER